MQPPDGARTERCVADPLRAYCPRRQPTDHRSVAESTNSRLTLHRGRPRQAAGQSYERPKPEGGQSVGSRSVYVGLSGYAMAPKAPCQNRHTQARISMEPNAIDGTQRGERGRRACPRTDRFRGAARGTATSAGLFAHQRPAPLSALRETWRPKLRCVPLLRHPAPAPGAHRRTTARPRRTAVRCCDRVPLRPGARLLEGRRYPVREAA
jgi:hypothetical protein